MSGGWGMGLVFFRPFRAEELPKQKQDHNLPIPLFIFGQLLLQMNNEASDHHCQSHNSTAESTI